MPVHVIILANVSDDLVMNSIFFTPHEELMYCSMTTACTAYNYIYNYVVVWTQLSFRVMLHLIKRLATETTISQGCSNIEKKQMVSYNVWCASNLIEGAILVSREV